MPQCELQLPPLQELKCAGPGYLMGVTDPAEFTLGPVHLEEIPLEPEEQEDVCAWFQASPCPLSPLIPHCQCPSMGGGGPLVPPSQCDAGRGALRRLPQL